MSGNMFDNEPKTLASEDESGGAAASAALSNLFNSEQGYEIELGAAFPPDDAASSAAAAAAPNPLEENGSALASETLASAGEAEPSPSLSALAHDRDHTQDHHDTGAQVQAQLEHSQLAHRTKRPGTSRQHMLTRGGACEFCKRRKLKCTAEVPQCSACRRSNRECVYSQKKQRSRMKLLEDKVSELESRLAEAPRESAEPSTSTPIHHTHPPPPVAPEGFFTAQHQQALQQHDAPSAGVELSFLGLAEHSSLTLADMNLTPGGKHPEEPDLMTLADAAAADTDGRMPWDNLEPQVIADEIVKAIIGHERGGVGEKICAHL